MISIQRLINFLEEYHTSTAPLIEVNDFDFKLLAEDQFAAIHRASKRSQ